VQRPFSSLTSSERSGVAAGRFQFATAAAGRDGGGCGGGAVDGGKTAVRVQSVTATSFVARYHLAL